MKEARFYIPVEGGVECQLCPHHCRIKEGARGRCRSRECRDGKLWALSYGAPCALAVDPVEKKPLNNFLPGTWCLSLSCTGRKEAPEQLPAGNLVPLPELHRLQPFLPMVPKQRHLAGGAGGGGLHGVVG